jgi:hypothetical protein
MFMRTCLAYLAVNAAAMRVPSAGLACFLRSLPSTAMFDLPRCRPLTMADGEVFADSMAPSKHGKDPREGLSADNLAAETDWARSVVPGEVGALGSVGQLQAALDAAAKSGRRLIVLKFEIAGCKACVETHAPYARAAADLHEHGFFFTVDGYKAKAFCKKQVRVKLPPIPHLSRLTSSHIISSSHVTWSRWASRPCRALTCTSTASCAPPRASGPPRRGASTSSCFMRRPACPLKRNLTLGISQHACLRECVRAGEDGNEDRNSNEYKQNDE